MAYLASCQDRFHERWGHLRDPHVRALAWLLDAPDLLDAQAPRWEGKIARLQFDLPAVKEWLNALDTDTAALHASLAARPTTRVGRYAENLLAFYFRWCGILVAHGLQVREPGLGLGKATVGEFDFLIQDATQFGETIPVGLLHLELATKFYLFETVPKARANADEAADVSADTPADATANAHLCADITATTDAAEQFIGPNLADTLSAKMRKILHRQLALAIHPAARAVLPQAISRSQALIKGWLFYPTLGMQPEVSSGVAKHHCRGFWCSVRQFRKGHFSAGGLPHHQGAGFMVLSRLAWLAPASADQREVCDHNAMASHLDRHFATDSTPVMVVLMQTSLLQQETVPAVHPHKESGFDNGVWEAMQNAASQDNTRVREFARCFVVPDDWRDRAQERNQRSLLKWETA